ncbi:MAG: tRNA (N6-isopentenyl adenosine(37)-C2)-methylthiotransferase MiaB [Candidatus Limnocylindrales bacterium]|jgi:tRNA-2-methylthio-N6-dimethylallyladenosine synthase
MTTRTVAELAASLTATPLPGSVTVATAVDGRVAEFRPETDSLPAFFMWTLGCQMNMSDSEEMAGQLLAAGCTRAPSMEEADLVVINTCAVREHAEAKVIGRQGLLADLKKARPGMRVVLTGCGVRESERAGLARRFPAVDMFLRPDEEPELALRLGLVSAQAPIGLQTVSTAATTVLSGRPVSAADRLAASRASALAENRVARSSTISAWVPIVYGCDKTCTYCIVPFSRGPERSRPFDDIVAEARDIAAAGFKELTLLGQNVNSYGHDLSVEERFGHIETERSAGRRLDLRSRPDLAELLCAIDGISGPDGRPAISRLRFVTSHPWDLSDRLIEAMATCESVAEHLHLPIQSGDDEMLQRMGRQYTVAHYKERLARIREAVPGIAVSTDVIVGFCGETEEQFQATLAALEEIRYDTVFAAAYSPRPGTPALQMADDVPPAVKRRRLNELLARQELIGLGINREWLGRDVEVLVERVMPPRRSIDPNDADAADEPVSEIPPLAGTAGEGSVALSGRTRHNKLVHLAGDPGLVGHAARVHIDHAGPFALRGRLVEAADEPDVLA